MNGDATARLSVVVLTFNSERTIGATLASAARVSADIHVVDSGSTDSTLELARQAGAHIVRHPFDNYAASRNWAIDTLPMTGEWELHLDADERLSDALVDEIARLMRAPPADIEGFFIPRLTQFHGTPIRHGGLYPIWHMRLFRRGRGRCEARRYDQHFYVAGATARIEAPMIDDVRMGYGEFMARHRRWAQAEADEVVAPGEGVIAARADGDPVERQRHRRAAYYRAPLFLRAVALFLYRYFWRLGFLDGAQGLVYFSLQTLWYRWMVDSQILKRRLGKT